ncbi:ABC transporter permease [Humitalea sp. 24SJ18S-53]|uniref:ABC transporter permease n=1 Tax=Humitalea sp. 24SJ18S-53 TaxID=3422307 RepID=UPI003D66D043
MTVFLRRMFRRRSAILGLVLLLGVVVLALTASRFWPDDPFDMVASPLLAPGEDPDFLLGSDNLGRDMGAAVAYGARVSLLVGLASALTATLIGVGIGAIAGYFGGWVDDVLMRLTEIFQTIPPFLFAIVLVAILSPTVWTIVTALTVVSWPPLARLARAEVMALRDREFVLSCVAFGMSDARIILLQILPNAAPPLIVAATITAASAILAEAGLSFLGLGDPNVMSWGTMIGLGRDLIRTAPWVVTVPGIAVLLTVLGLNLVGEGLNDALNPRLRERSA